MRRPDGKFVTYDIMDLEAVMRRDWWRRKVPDFDKSRAHHFVMPGDTIIAKRDGGRDKDGLPLDVPQAGCRYVVDSFYVASYGMGVVLSNVDGTPMDNYPYRGYVFVKIEQIEGSLHDVVPYFIPDTEDAG